MQKAAGGRPHALVESDPDGDGVEHDVGRGEAGDGQGAQQGAAGAVVGGGDGGGVEGHQPVAEPLDRGDEVGGFGLRAAPGQAQAAGGHVHPAFEQAGFARKHLLNEPDAGAALQAVEREGQGVRPVRPGFDVAGKIPALGGLGPRRPQRGIEQPLFVIPTEFKP